MSGLVHIYCGEGKGKTTAAVGLAIRCVGNGENVVFAQFLKDGTSGECQILRKLSTVTFMYAHPCLKFSFQMNDAEKSRTKSACQTLLQEAMKAAKDARLLILDEVMAAITNDFLDSNSILEILKQRPQNLEVVLTGRNPPDALLEYADYVSQIQKVKHPFDRGITARQGIEK